MEAPKFVFRPRSRASHLGKLDFRPTRRPTFSGLTTLRLSTYYVSQRLFDTIIEPRLGVVASCRLKPSQPPNHCYPLCRFIPLLMPALYLHHASCTLIDLEFHHQIIRITSYPTTGVILRRVAIISIFNLALLSARPCCPLQLFYN